MVLISAEFSGCASEQIDSVLEGVLARPAGSNAALGAVLAPSMYGMSTPRLEVQRLQEPFAGIVKQVQHLQCQSDIYSMFSTLHSQCRFM
jgi:hypothetical protein